MNTQVNPKLVLKYSTILATIQHTILCTSVMISKAIGSSMLLVLNRF